MTLPHGTDRLESARLVLRRMTPDDLTFYTRIHALPDVARFLWPEGRPRSPEQTKTWLDGALIGRCGLMEMTWDRWVWPLATTTAAGEPS